jgi:hypothetical protein
MMFSPLELMQSMQLKMLMSHNDDAKNMHFIFLRGWSGEGVSSSTMQHLPVLTAKSVVIKDWKRSMDQQDLKTVAP